MKNYFRNEDHQNTDGTWGMTSVPVDPEELRAIRREQINIVIQNNRSNPLGFRTISNMVRDMENGILITDPEEE